MDSRLKNFIIFLAVVLVVFALAIFVLSPRGSFGSAAVGQGSINLDFSVDPESSVLRFVFVVVGLLIAFAVYYSTKQNEAWEVGTRQVVWMAIGAALYAVLSWLFNASVFVVPSVSQVALRPAIAIPMFFGYAFGPVVGFFTGAVGNLFGDALTGFGLSPQWSVGNGLIGFIAGCWMLFKDRKQSMNTVLYVSGALVLVTAILFFLNRNTPNMTFFDPANNVFGDASISLFAGISIVIGFILVLAVRFGFASNENVATAVMWSMLGNILGLLFASLADIFINGFSLPTTIVGQFLPAAGPNLIFAAILVPMLVGAYASVQRQSGR
ncbi:MAG: ECF transporter S component [Anaerolineales bacterium]|nr:ECF transporter S component [Anaerolineales bacterium]MCZ2122961.1 ECF transporter S component [Anaerolineales bacterium]